MLGRVGLGTYSARRTGIVKVNVEPTRKPGRACGTRLAKSERDALGYIATCPRDDGNLTVKRPPNIPLRDHLRGDRASPGDAGPHR